MNLVLKKEQSQFWHKRNDPVLKNTVNYKITTQKDSIFCYTAILFGVWGGPK